MSFWPTHRYRIMAALIEVHEGDNLLVAMDLFGQVCGCVPQGAELWFNAGHHDRTGEPLVEARYPDNRLLAVLYGVTLEQWLEHGVQHVERAIRASVKE